MKKMSSERKVHAATRAIRIQEAMVISFHMEGKGNPDFYQAQAETDLRELAEMMGFKLVPAE